MSQFKAVPPSIINTISGKNLVGHASQEDVQTLIMHIWALEFFMDQANEDDTFGTEGWRHRLGIE